MRQPIWLCDVMIKTFIPKPAIRRTARIVVVTAIGRANRPSATRSIARDAMAQRSSQARSNGGDGFCQFQPLMKFCQRNFNVYLWHCEDPVSAQHLDRPLGITACDDRGNCLILFQ